ncbi:hypothetical protein BJF79_03265 [Actinomadura sp. CNU-125]|uniref:hypothetical protein n=1 Tax=Actinomadura sp. CNU-125 TaxID=1904961 RepID=UPI0009675461|nr:hypothetical protein [Actinomadura sp. CNU-125]OLT12932.1 hypothetical protein BJF79_03265 [Actinomadura sp. CNU-125]
MPATARPEAADRRAPGARTRAAGRAGTRTLAARAPGHPAGHAAVRPGVPGAGTARRTVPGPARDTGTGAAAPRADVAARRAAARRDRSARTAGTTAAQPSPSPSQEVVHHTVQRAADEKPQRRDPLSTSLVLVVIAVVVSAGTAVAFAR